MSGLRLFLLGLILWFAGPAGAAEPSFAGEWDTTYGLMKLKVDGPKVSGTYQYEGGGIHDIRGTLEGLKWQFTYQEPGVTGEGSFTLAADGQSFTGRWREKGGGTWQTWTGRRPVPGGRRR